MKSIGLIDYSSKPPVGSLSIRAPHLENYGRIYGGRDATTPEPPEDYSEAALQKYLASYADVGARKVVIKARDLETTFGQKIRNEDVAAFCREHGERCLGFAGVDPHKAGRHVRDDRHGLAVDPAAGQGAEVTGNTEDPVAMGTIAFGAGAVVRQDRGDVRRSAVLHEYRVQQTHEVVETDERCSVVNYRGLGRHL